MGGPKGGSGAEGWGGPKFRAFFPSPAHIFEPKRAHLIVPVFKTPPKFNEKTPREGRKERILRREKGKKSEILGGPAEGAVRGRGSGGAHKSWTRHTQQTHTQQTHTQQTQGGSQSCGGRSRRGLSGGGEVAESGENAQNTTHNTRHTTHNNQNNSTTAHNSTTAQQHDTTHNTQTTQTTQQHTHTTHTTH